MHACTLARSRAYLGTCMYMHVRMYEWVCVLVRACSRACTRVYTTFQRKARSFGGRSVNNSSRQRGAPKMAVTPKRHQRHQRDTKETPKRHQRDTKETPETPERYQRHQRAGEAAWPQRGNGQRGASRQPGSWSGASVTENLGWILATCFCGAGLCGFPVWAAAYLEGRSNFVLTI